MPIPEANIAIWGGVNGEFRKAQTSCAVLGERLI